MADLNPTGRDCAGRGPESPANEDAQLERAVLGWLSAEHPTQLTLSELYLALSGETADFRRTDAIERAVDELEAAGLLRRSGAFVVLTRAALRFAALELP